MTLGYVAATYHVPEAVLAQRLGLSAATDPSTRLNALAERKGLSRSAYVEQVQRAIGDVASQAVTTRAAARTGWFARLGDAVLGAVLVHGYAAVGLALLLASLGVPVPDAVVATIAGSLVAQHRLHWFWAGATAVLAATIGDVAGYALGWWAGRAAVERNRRWFRRQASRHARASRMFEQWGLVAVLATHALLSAASPPVNLLAGASRLSPSAFIALCVVGCVVWTVIFMSLGYAIGPDLGAASDFLINLPILLVALSGTAAAALVASGKIVLAPAGETTRDT